MGNILFKYKHYFIFAGFALVLGFAFQNCSGARFAAQPDIVDAACNSSSGCTSAASSQPSQDTSNTNGSSVDPSTLYNFAAGDKASCEASIQSRLGLNVACTMGGGCGYSCGFPGPNCPSANPTLWGACMTSKGLGANATPLPAPAPALPSSSFYNIVAGDKATCENAVRTTLGSSASCSIGGGCGFSCGVPGPNCPSANPTLWGACL